MINMIYDTILKVDIPRMIQTNSSDKFRDYFLRRWKNSYSPQNFIPFELPRLSHIIMKYGITENLIYHSHAYLKLVQIIVFTWFTYSTNPRK